MTSEEKPNELYLLKRKRDPGCFYTKIDHDIIYQKENEFSIINSKLENIRKINESKYDINKIKPDPNNNEINLKKLLSEPSNNLKQKEYNKSKIFIIDKKGNLFNNSSVAKNSSTKLKYFNVEKNIIKKSIIDFDTNNEIKIFKNKKIVYINKDLLNNYSTSRSIKKAKNINFVIRNQTSSKYRGVSKNGSYWQVLIMANNKKYYIGNYPSEELAARVYDIHAIKMRGIKARTNFPYNNVQIKNILEKDINIKYDSISEIMKQINN